MNPALLAVALASLPALAGAGPADALKAAEERGRASFRSHAPGQPFADQASGALAGDPAAVERLRRLLGDAREVQEGCALPCADAAEVRLYLEKIKVAAAGWGIGAEVPELVERYAPGGVPRKRAAAGGKAGAAPSALEAEAMRRLLAEQSLPPGVRDALTGRVNRWAKLLEQNKDVGALGTTGAFGAGGGSGRSMTREQVAALSRQLAAQPRAGSPYLATLRVNEPPAAAGGRGGAPATGSASGGSAGGGAPVGQGAVPEYAPGEVRPQQDPGLWARIKDSVKNPLSDAYGVTVRTGGRDRAFRQVPDADRFLATLPAGSVEKVTYYGHGAPGMMTLGSYTIDPDRTAGAVKGKIRAGGMVDFVGCNTASVGTETRVNPAYGLSTLTRRLLYFSIPYLSDKASGGGSKDMKETMEQMWDEDLAQQTSVRVKGVKVCGLRTFGLVGDRIPVVGTLMGRREATSSSAVAGVHACYIDGREVER